jgi:hypothetical protein
MDAGGDEEKKGGWWSGGDAYRGRDARASTSAYVGPARRPLRGRGCAA